MAIQLDKVCVDFRAPDGQRLRVLDLPELIVPDSSQTCLVGGSGSGKTTLLNVIAGIVQPTSGRVLVDDEDIGAMNEASRDAFRAAKVGYVFQTFNLLQGLSARENVQLALGFAGKRGAPARRRAEELLDRMGLSSRMNAKPGTMSVGEQQRVAIARAVANEPRVVLADEPTANLDESNGDEVLALLREVTNEVGSILLLVTHEKRIFEQFERVQPLAELMR